MSFSFALETDIVSYFHLVILENTAWLCLFNVPIFSLPRSLSIYICISDIIFYLFITYKYRSSSIVCL